MKPTLTLPEIQSFANLTLRRAIYNWRMWHIYRGAKRRAKDFATLRFVRFCLSLEDYRRIGELKPSQIRRKNAQLKRYYDSDALTNEDFRTIAQLESDYKCFAANGRTRRNAEDIFPALCNL